MSPVNASKCLNNSVERDANRACFRTHCGNGTGHYTSHHAKLSWTGQAHQFSHAAPLSIQGCRRATPPDSMQPHSQWPHPDGHAKIGQNNDILGGRPSRSKQRLEMEICCSVDVMLFISGLYRATSTFAVEVQETAAETDRRKLHDRPSLLKVKQRDGSSPP